MSGVGLRVDQREVEQLARRVERLADIDTTALLHALGAEGESQTRRRLEEEKTAPDGTPWAPWSESHAGTRRGGRSLLVGEGDLLDSVQYEVSADEVEWGSNLVYAAVHQLGGADVGMPLPARPYLGLSDENLADLQSIVDEYIDSALRRL